MSGSFTSTEVVSGWGMFSKARVPVARPESVGALKQVLAEATERGLTVGLRGSGCSYGDAALNSDGVVLDLSRMNRILGFDEQTGVLIAEPGVTIKQTWEHALPKGFWPPVVPGTMFPTLGGCLSMNIHGKNNFQAGTLGEYVEWFELMSVDGTIHRCSPTDNDDLYHAAIGGFGVLGVFTKIALRMKRVHSGDLWVKAIDAPNIEAMVAAIEERHRDSDYLVGWVDGYPKGAHLGRGLIHQAHYLAPGEDDAPQKSFLPEHQNLPSTFFGIVPKSWLWSGLWCFLNRPGMRVVNAVKYRSGVRHAKAERHRQSLVGFSFLLDYVPNWKRAYKPGGLIQYQTFVPKARAAATFRSQIELAQRHGIPPYLGVLKKHKLDPFLMTHAVDGYSLAMDLPVRKGTKDRVWRLAAEMDEIVTDAGGRFYFAKDSTLSPDGLLKCYPKDRIDAFLALKRRLDPDHRLETDLFRRLFAPIARSVHEIESDNAQIGS